jgi:tRNA modification GTPase
MLSDVIAALATPSGRSALALIRVSGSGSHEVARVVLRPFSADPLRTARRARVASPSTHEVIDDVVYVTYRRPHSYTGEDVVEITTHGGLLVPAEVTGALLAAGARAAQPGEFTRRALLNGKMDLLQAESVGDLIDATAPAQRRAALNQLERGLTRRIDTLRGDVLDLEALVCYEIDFPEEDSGPVSPERIAAATDAVDASFRRLLETAVEGERLREGALTVIAGRPNAGKSSLFNSLLGTDRAIVTEVPGTTRDAIEAPVSCDGFPFRLVDTAGLGSARDRLERLGIEVSRRYLERADVVLFCVEAGRELDAVEREFLDDCRVPVVVVRTKADLAAPGRGGAGVAVSAVTGTGLAALRAELASLAFSRLAVGADVEPLLTRERHRLALERARSEIAAFREARGSGLEGAVASVHLRAAVHALEDVIGAVTTEDVLDRVFATFCVGK